VAARAVENQAAAAKRAVTNKEAVESPAVVVVHKAAAGPVEAIARLGDFDATN
jgi:hypothetical protein